MGFDKNKRNQIREFNKKKVIAERQESKTWDQKKRKKAEKKKEKGKKGDRYAKAKDPNADFIPRRLKQIMVWNEDLPPDPRMVKKQARLGEKLKKDKLKKKVHKLKAEEAKWKKKRRIRKKGELVEIDSDADNSGLEQEYVPFGEVVHEPPKLELKPKMEKNLFPTASYFEKVKSSIQQKPNAHSKTKTEFELMRQNVVESYRKHKGKLYDNKPTTDLFAHQFS
eukprot:NODE_7146_length_789_cov_85.894895_g6907_i0.p1 GENE.NODE_7146_length_789_cov_85.894895_g6907_i0~~NODE_7146_length_789_cov_85.894895_g6907_i0.p1  ORF type:complete len:224 (-),score=50.38 NODE_7146_length_789_cov_85.894895_g6907_i0:20-691(-)